MNHHCEFAASLLAKGGPEREDYPELDAWVAELGDHLRCGRISQEELARVIKVLGDAFSVHTMQGHAFQKPHGYPGDFEIIDRIYQRYESSQPHLTKWDRYWQSHPAAEAVRNRVDYFGEQLRSHEERKAPDGIRVLNLASGPGRDMLHFFRNNPTTRAAIDCVEQDANAIRHARALCKDHLRKVSFYQRNVLRFQSTRPYDLIWSAGLFDYFSDKAFVLMLRRLKSMLAPGGEIVVGNFSPINPSRHYMEVFNWVLHHRSPHTLRDLAIRAGFPADSIAIGSEPLGVNLFLHAGPRRAGDSSGAPLRVAGNHG
ncbi:MAG: class I SAM-dependent methyltransferase [Verrucomicrobiales bacterium]|nr:class I SAM-dependent methyltransferase [Verrucomicrobiales bacterium]MCP5525635.1 class I SAM-dependent methyltransferase [Verrucomicrobiales bacterium]